MVHKQDTHDSRRKTNLHVTTNTFTRYSTTHQSGATPHIGSVCNPREKLNLITPTSLDTLRNT